MISDTKKIVLFLPVVAILVLALAGCEGYRCGNGKVMDKATNQLLDSVFCEAVTSNQSMYTDSTGSFNVCNKISGCVPKCKDIVVRLSRQGYKTVTLENPEDVIIYMEK